MIILYTTERDYPWGTLRSTHASKTKVVLEEKGLKYRIENLPPGNLWKKPPEMLARHPLGKVPYLEDDGCTLFDSTVIAEYLEERYPKPALMPTDVIARERVREAENFADEAMLAGSIPLIWMPYWAEPAKRDTARMEQGREMLRKRDLPYLEKLLGEAGGAAGYVCGEFSLADSAFMPLAMVLEVDKMPLGDFPRVTKYLARLRERKSYRAISPSTKVADATAGG
jgi:glutathione S-transferase